MWNNLRPALVIARREIKEELRDWRIVFPLLILTFVFPALLNFTAQQAVGFVERSGGVIVAERIIPFLLMIGGFFPISVSLFLALESFVGEKERNSIEPLLNSPIKDWQLFLGKLLSATFPPTVSGVMGMGIYILGLYLSGAILPEITLIIQLIILTVIQAFVMVSGAVVVSSQSMSVRSANLLAAFIIIPSAILMQVEAMIIFWGSFESLWWIMFGMVVLSILLIRIGLAYFQREELVTQQLDSMSFQWGWKVFKASLVDDAHSWIDWNTRVVGQGIRRLSLPILLASIIAVCGVLIGMIQIDEFTYPAQQGGVSGMESQLESIIQSLPLYSMDPVLQIWWQNVRVMLVSLVLGVISFGVFGMIPMVASLGMVGYLMEIVTQSGTSPWVYLFGFILPHGVFEIFGVIVACAAILRLGAVLATPFSGKRLGEVWLGALADWVKVMVGLVVPVLFVAAAVEAWLTPRLALLLLR